jgi:serine/threonine protein kinase
MNDASSFPQRPAAGAAPNPPREILGQQGPGPDVREFLAGAGKLAQLAAALAVDQRQRWQRGERIRAEDYLKGCPALAADTERALELVYGEFLLREELGEAPRADEYLERFPRYAARLRQQFSLHQALASAASHPPAPPSEAATVPAAPAPPGGVLADLPRVPGYEIVTELGRGGMGVVYLARQTQLNRLVAVKMILASGLAGEQELARFRTEAEAAAHLEHPRIVPIYEVGEHKGKHYFSMKLVEGGSLAQHMKKYVQDPKATATLMLAVARAIQYAHERGILHRDLKPANILVDREGRPAITDFGVAKKVGNTFFDLSTQDNGDRPSGLTMQGEIVGTPSYMAPEQAAGKKGLTTAVDIYSLGAILYEMLTGRPPYQAATQLATLRLVLERPPQPPRTVNPTVDRDLEAICLKCMERQPENRYRSAEALVEDLERYLAGEPVRANPESRWRRARRWMRRHPALVFMACGCAVIIGLFFNGTLWQWHKTEQALRGEELARQDAAAAEARVEMATYLRRMASVEQDWSAGRLGQARKLLGATPEAQRQWEWHCMHRLLYSERQEPLVLASGGAGFTCLAFTPDGRRVAVGTADHLVKIFDAASGQLLGTFEKHQSLVTAVAFHPGGRMVLSASLDGAVKLWDAATGEEELPIPTHPDGAGGVAFTADGRFFATGGGDACIRLFETNSGRESARLSGHQDTVTAVAFGGAGNVLVSASADRTARVWHGRDGIWEPGPILTGHADLVRGVAVSFQAGLVATASWDRTVKLWDLSTGKERFTLHGHGDRVSAVSFSADGKRLASAGWDQTVRLWDTGLGLEALALRGHQRPVFAVQFSPNDGRLSSAGTDGTARVWHK